MKIAVCLASRARPAALINVVMGAHRLVLGQQQVEFVIGLDEDDDRSHAIMDLRPFDDTGIELCFPEYLPAPQVRGEMENRMLIAARGQTFGGDGLDLVTLLSDRTVIISPGWDKMLAAAVQREPRRVMWWACQDDPGCVIPIIPRAYLDAIDWRWSEEIFPFWWEDTWHQEIDLLLYGPPSLKVKAFYAGARGKTRNARDFGFWLDVFTATRDHRRALAAHIADVLKVPLQQRGDVENYFRQYDQTMRERIAIFEAHFGDPNPPNDNYLAAKDRAAKLLHEVA